MELRYFRTTLDLLPKDAKQWLAFLIIICGGLLDAGYTIKTKDRCVTLSHTTTDLLLSSRHLFSVEVRIGGGIGEL